MNGPQKLVFVSSKPFQYRVTKHYLIGSIPKLKKIKCCEYRPRLTCKGEMFASVKLTCFFNYSLGHACKSSLNVSKCLKGGLAN
jgi:hypothetical protein